MKAILFGATGMVGEGVLRECLEAPEVEAVLAIGRSSCRITHPKLRELIRSNLYDYGDIAGELTGCDACFFCLGVSSFRMSEADYARITYDLTLAAAQALVKANPKMTFCYVSGLGTDSSEKGSSMWARVKGRTENALMTLGFKAVYLFRPGYIQPMKGVRSKTPLYRAVYAIGVPLYPLFKRLSPNAVTTTENVGRAMIRVVAQGHASPFLENRDINALAA